MTIQAGIFHPYRVNVDRLTAERAALQAAIESRVLQTRPRLASLLKYICERHFEGNAGGIKEYSIATEVFGRPDSFDQATDSIVRVEVFRLRKKLREFYEGEGEDQSIEIVIATGHYRPEFVDRFSKASPLQMEERSPAGTAVVNRVNLEPAIETMNLLGDSEADPAQRDDLTAPTRATTGIKGRPYWQLAMLGIGAPIAAVLAVASTMWWFNQLRPLPTISPSQPALYSALPEASGQEVRIRCGYSRPVFKDDEGNVWTGDRFFTGGFVTELPNQPIARTRNPELYLTARSGVFTYNIPLVQGVYELHLHFAETTYSPASTLGGGENSRVFDVRLNGRPLLSQFDIVSDAGANTADVRVFRDIAPDRDGHLHLEFNGSLGLPMINAIELVPGLAHRLRPIRMVAQNSFFEDQSGNLWMPDTYFNGGRLASDKVVIGGTPEPGLFIGERYGNFTYALPVDEGSYKMTLYFSEKYWGSVSNSGGSGSRVFDVLCNGTALTRRLDIFKEAGPGRALIKVYHGLRPNAQGKLIVSFVPDINYASVDAVELEQEGP
jgi:hypothetical protein